jgi:glycosyltransferase involved in cell wall biosynthesis
MQCGTPSVTTPIGAEGIAGELNWNGFITNDPKEFVEKAMQLYSEENVWLASVENGFRIINSRFNKNAFQQKFLERITDLFQNIDFYRQKNFIGKLLQHHQHRSTYFMAKFIEEKEKNKKTAG